LPVMPISGVRIPASEKMIHHLGLVFFLPILCRLQGFLGSKATGCLQTVSQLLLGAVNVEQGKLLSASALEFLIGGGIVGRQGLRTRLDNLYSGEFITLLGRANLSLFNRLKEAVMFFYYDPHGKHDTGNLPILKGWCGQLKDTVKVLYSDYIHDEDGRPLFLKHYDNMYDLRERIILTLYEFSKIFFETPPKMTFVIDRGIYGLNAMRVFIDKGYDLITWEKGYKKKSACKKQASGARFIWEKPKNNGQDFKTYRFEYQEEAWKPESRFR
jgi:hypothetical protein